MSHVSFRRFGSVAAAGHSPLSDDQLRGLAPSAFAAGKHESRSERYTYIPTSAVIDGLRANGFAPTFAKQGRSRIVSVSRHPRLTALVWRFRRPWLRGRPCSSRAGVR